MTTTVERPKLTAAKRKCLQWALREGEVAQWPVAVCSLTTVRKCVADGLLETCGLESMVPRMGLAFTKYRLTEAGRAALAEEG